MTSIPSQQLFAPSAKPKNQRKHQYEQALHQLFTFLAFQFFRFFAQLLLLLRSPSFALIPSVSPKGAKEPSKEAKEAEQTQAKNQSKGISFVELLDFFDSFFGFGSSVVRRFFASHRLFASFGFTERTEAKAKEQKAFHYLAFASVPRRSRRSKEPMRGEGCTKEAKSQRKKPT
uniref:Uncharacterized protein n=1 Tax=Pediastrum duplex TaxID=3105 RepID=A0A2U8GIL8_PEDDU|nr:hypothetical protein [Pediastrum duplex]